MTTATAVVDVDLEIVAGKLTDLWQDHVSGRCKLNRPEAALLARWQTGDCHLVGKALDQAIKTLQNHGRWPDEPSTPAGGPEQVNGPLCGRCNWPFEPTCGECGPPADGDGSITAGLASGGPITDALIGRAPSTPGRPIKNALRLVRTADIVVGKRFRQLNMTEVAKLADNLVDSGRLLQPIGVTSDMHLVWGAHRLRAATDLGWREIPAQILPYDSGSQQAKIDELDENLRRCELTALEQAQALAARKTAYELLHPEARRGVRGGRKPQPESPAAHWLRDDGVEIYVFKGLGTSGWMAGFKSAAGGHHRIKSPYLTIHKTQSAAQRQLDKYAEQKGWTKLTDTVAVSSPPPQPVAPVESFAADAARQTGKSERTIRRATAIGAKIVPEVAEAVAKVPAVAKSPKELAKLAKLDPALQRSVAACLTSGECKTVTEAVAESDDPPPAPAEQACDVLKRLLDEAARRWCAKCGKAATAQLAAGVLESVAEEWISQDWRRTGGPAAAKKRHR